MTPRELVDRAVVAYVTGGLEARAFIRRAGVTLTPEEAAQLVRVLAALRRPGGVSIAELPVPADLDRLAARLEAAS